MNSPEAQHALVAGELNEIAFKSTLIKSQGTGHRMLRVITAIHLNGVRSAASKGFPVAAEQRRCGVPAEPGHSWLDMNAEMRSPGWYVRLLHCAEKRGY